jgi:protease-4
MRFAGKVWKLLVGIKDGLVLLFMLISSACSMRRCRPARRTAPASGALLLDLDRPDRRAAGAQATAARCSAAAAPREYRLATSSTRSRPRRGRPDQGGRARSRHLRGRRPDDDDRRRRGARPGPQGRQAGLAYATGYDDDSYQLAAHASEIWLDPMGAVLVAGPGGANLYYQGLMDKLGSPPTSTGSAPTRRRSSPSPAATCRPRRARRFRRSPTALWESWQQDVRQARPKAQLAPYVADPAGADAAAGGDMARAPRSSGAWSTGSATAAFRPAGRRDRRHGGRRRPRQLPRDPTIPGSKANPASDSGGEIGVLTVAGDIVDGEAGLGTAGAETIVRALERGPARGNLKALVVRVDSPAARRSPRSGSARRCSPPRRRACRWWSRWAAVAASGGYWVATAGDKIFAEPSTITGSIGVFGLLPSFEGALPSSASAPTASRRRRCRASPTCCAGPRPKPTGCCRWASRAPTGASSLWSRRRASCRSRGSTRSPRAGSGTAAPPASSAWSTRSAGSTTRSPRRRGGPSSIPDDADVVWLEKEPGFADGC